MSDVSSSSDDPLRELALDEGSESSCTTNCSDPEDEREGLQYEGGYVAEPCDDELFVRCLGWYALPAKHKGPKVLWVKMQTKRGVFPPPALDCLIQYKELKHFTRGQRLFERALRRKG